MRTVSVMAMKFTLVDGSQPVDAHLPQLMPAMLNHIQDQDRCTFSLLTLLLVHAYHTVPLLPLVHACQNCAGFDMRSHRDQHLCLLLVLVVAVQSSQHQAWFASS